MNRIIAYKISSVYVSPEVTPVSALTFRTDKLDVLGLPGRFQWDEKINVAILTMIHMYYRIMSPLHSHYTILVD